MLDQSVQYTVLLGFHTFSSNPVNQSSKNYLLFLQYGRNTIERKHKSRKNSVEEDNERERPKVTITVGDVKDVRNGKLHLGDDHLEENHKLENGRAMLITREDLILAPDPELNWIGNNNLEVSVSN